MKTCQAQMNSFVFVFSRIAIQEILETESILSTIPIYCCCSKEQSILKDVLWLENELKNVSAQTPKELAQMKVQDSVYYIYTSGTTGLPKAAVIKQYR